MLDINKYNILLNSNKKQKKLDFKNEEKIAKIVDIYDGDTCNANIFICDEIYKFRLRLNGFDSPEIKTDNTMEKEYAKISKQILEKLILNKIVKLKCYKLDKYGRILCDIFLNDENNKIININEYMITNKYGIIYGGGKKNIFDEKNFNEEMKIIETKNIY